MQRNQKAISLIYLVCGCLAGLFFRELVQTIWVMAHLPMPADWVVAPPDLVAIGCGLTTFLLLIKNVRVSTFTNEVITELGKVTWPNGKETVLSTGVVSVLVGICSVILFVFDMVWGAAVSVFYR